MKKVIMLLLLLCFTGCTSIGYYYKDANKEEKAYWRSTKKVKASTGTFTIETDPDSQYEALSNMMQMIKSATEAAK